MGISVGMGWSINEGCVNYYEAFKEEGGYGVRFGGSASENKNNRSGRKSNIGFSFMQ